MKYLSTRDCRKQVTASEAIVKGISEDGGLFVPSSFPSLRREDFERLGEMDYPERAAEVLSLYLDDYTKEELIDFCEKAYSRFDGDPCPLVKIDDALYVMELWHGPTCAFKDMALTLLPYLLVAGKKKQGIDEKTLILVATSGDTGKAALEGFKDVDGTEIIVFYPSDGVSDMQKLQMATQEGKNVHVAAIKGNFDDAQTAVKKLFNDKTVIEKLKAKGIAMSSANSINWGRLAPQIAYYVSAYCDLVSGGEIAFGEKINFVVPTGNFGNILAGYYAYRMGVPVNKLIVASNANNVLTQFFADGRYDIDRDFYKTMSPSMDILVSSNLERLIFELCDRDDEKVRELYDGLKRKGYFEIDVELLNDTVFGAGWADEEETKEAIYTYFDLNDYVFDTHTAVAASVYADYSAETEDETVTVIVSTASPFKFARDVFGALGGKEKDSYKALTKLQMATAMDCPEALFYLKEKPVLHNKIIGKNDTEKALYEFMGIEE